MSRFPNPIGLPEVAKWMKAQQVPPWFAAPLDYVLTNVSSPSLTANATPHAKGAWAQLTASTPGACNALILEVHSVATTATATATLLDIGIGAAGSEVAIAENIAIGSAAVGTGNGINFTLPVYVPAGVRLAARIQSLVANKTCTLVWTLNYDRNGVETPTALDVLGTSTSTSTGTALSTAGTYVEVVAATAKTYSAIGIVPSASGTNMASYNLTYTLAVGPAGSEVDMAVFSKIVSSSAEYMARPNVSPAIYALNIPTGSRLSVKQAGATANQSQYHVTLIGVPA